MRKKDTIAIRDILAHIQRYPKLQYHDGPKERHFQDCYVYDVPVQGEQIQLLDCRFIFQAYQWQLHPRMCYLSLIPEQSRFQPQAIGQPSAQLWNGNP